MASVLVNPPIHGMCVYNLPWFTLHPLGTYGGVTVRDAVAKWVLQ